MLSSYLLRLICTIFVLVLSLSSSIYGDSSTSLRCILRDNPAVAEDIPLSRINDDYCDCQDGSDEPLTAACPGMTFLCRNSAFNPSKIPSAWVSDGYCDCCDGSDEPSGKCPNTCSDLRRKAFNEANRKAEIIRQGIKKRSTYITRARRKASDDQRSVESLKRQLKTISKTLDRAGRRVDALRAAKKRHLKAQKSDKTPDPSPPSDPSLVVDSSSLNDQEYHSDSNKHGTNNNEEQKDGQDISNFDDKDNFAHDLERDDKIDQADDNDFDVQAEFEDPGEGADIDSGTETGHDNAEDSEYDETELHEGAQDDDVEDEDDDEVAGEEDDIEDDYDYQDDAHDDENEDIGDDDSNEDDSFNPKMETQESPAVTPKPDDLSQYEIDAICADLESQGSNTFVRGLRYVRARAMKMLHRRLPSVVRPPKDSAISDIDSCIRQADNAKHKLESRQSELNRQIHKLEKQITLGYGPDGVLRPLHGICVKTKVMQYEFEHCPFDLVRQYEHGHAIAILGRYDSLKHEDDNIVLEYKDGDRCWNGPVRTIRVQLVCGVMEDVVSVDEPNRCTYSMKFKTPAVCDQKMIDELMADFKSDADSSKEDL